MGQVAYHCGRLPHCKLTGSWKLYFCLLYLAKRVFGENEYYNYYRRKYYCECCWICRCGRKSLNFAPFQYKLLTASDVQTKWIPQTTCHVEYVKNYCRKRNCGPHKSFPSVCFAHLHTKKSGVLTLLAALRRSTVFVKCIDNLETIKSPGTLPLVCCDGHANMYDMKTYYSCHLLFR